MISPPSENEDLDFEPEEELGTVGAVKAKMQKLRDELKEAKAKRDEYLDGWQRAKADMVNSKKRRLNRYLVQAVAERKFWWKNSFRHSMDSTWRCRGRHGILSTKLGDQELRVSKRRSRAF